MISLTKRKTLRDIAIEQVERLKGNREPDGWLLKNGIYWLSKAEYCECCRKQYPSTLKYKERLKSHARTIDHVARRFNVEPKALRKEVRVYKDSIGEKI